MEIQENSAQKMLIPVLIGGAAMALISYIPLLNTINCLCCAGIMGGAVLGVWFYRKTYPTNQGFGPKEGAKIGALSGIVGAVLYSLLELARIWAQAAVFNSEFRDALDQAMSQMESQGQDPAKVEQASKMIMSIMDSPLMLAAILFVSSLLMFTAFGAIGGAIGGKIFKRLPAEPMHPQNPDGDMY